MLLSMQGIMKSFAGVSALQGVTLEIGEGEIMALVGQNGAGKSTLIKILTGAYQRDGGTIRFDGKDVSFSSPAESQAGGIATIYQEINLAPQRSVAENIYLCREPCKMGFLDRRAMRDGARKVLQQFKLDIDVEMPVSRFSAATRQMVAIARAVMQDAKLLIMDEPTSSLDEREVAVLFETIRTLQKNGLAVCFIGHRLDELYALCERVTIMRDGKTVAAGPLANMSKMDLVQNMLGRELAAFEAIGRDIEVRNDKPIRLQLNKGGHGVRVREVELSLREGEITGLAGLLGSGRTETARILFGVDKLERGSLLFEGQPRHYSEPAAAIVDGIGLVSEDRKVDGIIPDMSIRDNMTLALLPKLKKNGVVDRARQDEIVAHFIKSLGIKCASPEQAIKELSGGNQQKVLLARWLCTNPRVLIIDEPTRGIDIGAKTEILKLLRGLADEGLSVLMISSEIEELLAVADRVIVLSDGMSVAELPRQDLSEAILLAAMAHQVN
ncbi:sugar ABC transporter ATP-binding protein [Agrobacterium rhizogenes]|uniref:sugar ABC transporter ATP-binding protein n=1 Tax=Rhizobium rhizogenes TaxID=359 RepID=UPI0015719E54|nr:sugar ABC transporter ATP-binding protein [Rhizobium rhizogenes]NTF59520.1 sugar ABC transporter ATP-binding protein [Rhizobium rhizogenes]NTF79080.1 sugar ABC transporter ATP-binding protein [Rhizobium rhizogenes]NTG18311.1 sugar ABC transporter ATP-binding protein [Rhizobium rhizogenes]NTH55472.1 sugar ABC transporter ATP-binding protein [Rhizobium rhizogenes]NTH75055.1 sugar ABC transporter ATP-binding protein [Rhizobium rhizogenes]